MNNIIFPATTPQPTASRPDMQAPEVDDGLASLLVRTLRHLVTAERFIQHNLEELSRFSAAFAQAGEKDELADVQEEMGLTLGELWELQATSDTLRTFLEDLGLIDVTTRERVVD